MEGQMRRWSMEYGGEWCLFSMDCCCCCFPPPSLLLGYATFFPLFPRLLQHHGTRVSPGVKIPFLYNKIYGWMGFFAEVQPGMSCLGSLHCGLYMATHLSHRFACQAAARAFSVKERRRRNIKVIVQQLRSSANVNNVEVILKKWVKSRHPKRSDWLNLLKEFQEDEEMLIQIFEFALLDETFEGNIRDYTKLMSTYIKMNCYGDAERTAKTMEERGFFPDLIVYTMLFDMYSKSGRLDRVREILNEIKLLGLALDEIAYCSLINAYCRFGQPRDAEMLLEEFQETNSKIRINAYISVMKYYRNLGQVKEAERLFRTMQLKFIYPDRRACCVLMEAYIQADDLRSACLVLDNMLLEGFEPRDSSISTLLAAYEKKGMLDMAVETLFKLKSRSLKPGVETLRTLTGWFYKLGLVEGADLLFVEN